MRITTQEKIYLLLQFSLWHSLKYSNKLPTIESVKEFAENLNTKH